MKKLRTIFAAIAFAVAGPFISVAVPQLAAHAAAVTCSHGYVTFYDGLNATGANSNLFCLDLPTKWNLDSTKKFTNGIAMNNKISSLKFQETATNHPNQSSVTMFVDALWSGPGDYATYQKNTPLGQEDVQNLFPASMNNSVSSISAAACAPGPACQQLP